jgi:hypothetical protein
MHYPYPFYYKIKFKKDHIVYCKHIPYIKSFKKVVFLISK